MITAESSADLPKWTRHDGVYIHKYIHEDLHRVHESCTSQAPTHPASMVVIAFYRIFTTFGRFAVANYRPIDRVWVDNRGTQCICQGPDTTIKLKLTLISIALNLFTIAKVLLWLLRPFFSFLYVDISSG